MKKLLDFWKQETVLCVALLLAVVTSFVVTPDATYLNYIDFRTLAILFCLMAVMAGLQKQGVFLAIAKGMIVKVSGLAQIQLILVLLCFVLSMFITNDVALITLVPFTFTVLGKLGEETRKKMAVPTVVLQTMAANLGSMLTPIGNPQNLYLYGKSGISFGEFLGLMLPYSVGALVLILLFGWAQKPKEGKGQSGLVDFGKENETIGNGVHILIYLGLFLLSLLTVMRVIAYPVTLLVVMMVLLVLDREVLRRVDYSLLLTFVGFFVFIGNLGRMDVFRVLLQKVVGGHEVLAAVLSSQAISNVPAALLLSEFTGDYKALIVGVNLGGLGTLIASMASLISYKMIVKEMPGEKGAYFRSFTATGIAFLVALSCLQFVIGQ